MAQDPRKNKPVQLAAAIAARSRDARRRVIFPDRSVQLVQKLHKFALATPLPAPEAKHGERS